jgi:hypothetical protein
MLFQGSAGFGLPDPFFLQICGEHEGVQMACFNQHITTIRAGNAR